MSLSTFNRSNVVVLLLIAAGVLAMFFLPEIIDLQRAITGAGTPKKAAATEVVAIPESRDAPRRAVAASGAVSPLDEVLMLLDTGSEGRARVALPIAADMLGLRSSDEESKAESSEPGVVSEELGELQLSWAAIQSERSANALRHARGAALQLAKELGPRSPNTRYALFNFASGIGTALDPKSPKLMRPEEVIHYLERLDLAVSRSMSREPIDRGDYLAWAQISLGPVFEATRLGAREVNYTVPFDPQLTLSSLYVMHRRPDTAGKKQERVNVVATGYVRGKDAKAIKIIGANGKVRRRIGLPKADSDTDYRLFKTPVLDGRQDWTFVVEGVDGEKFEKTYRFYGRAMQYPWGKLEEINQSGYLLPFRNVMATPSLFNPREIDRRLDAHFAQGDIEGRSSNRIFETF
jgi:hypothetical protein